MSRLAGAIVNSLAPQSAPAAPKAKAKGKAKAKPLPAAQLLARQRSRIDLDDDVDDAKRLAKVAKDALRRKLATARAARRKKMRLVAKAAKLPSEDLYRIAVYKRVNLMNTMVSKDLRSSLGAAFSESDIPSMEALLKETLERKASASSGAGAASAPAAVAEDPADAAQVALTDASVAALANVEVPEAASPAAPPPAPEDDM